MHMSKVTPTSDQAAMLTKKTSAARSRGHARRWSSHSFTTTQIDQTVENRIRALDLDLYIDQQRKATSGITKVAEEANHHHSLVLARLQNTEVSQKAKQKLEKVDSPLSIWNICAQVIWYRKVQWETLLIRDWTMTFTSKTLSVTETICLTSFKENLWRESRRIANRFHSDQMAKANSELDSEANWKQYIAQIPTHFWTKSLKKSREREAKKDKQCIRNWSSISSSSLMSYRQEAILKEEREKDEKVVRNIWMIK